LGEAIDRVGKIVVNLWQSPPGVQEAMFAGVAGGTNVSTITSRETWLGCAAANV